MSEDNVQYGKPRNHRERYEQHKRFGIKVPDAVEVLLTLTDRLIQALYTPVLTDAMFKVNIDRAEAFGIEGEPINWGDLKCCEVQEFKDGSFLIIIDEAAPDQCPSLCNYITEYLTAWGWKVQVKTEW